MSEERSPQQEQEIIGRVLRGAKNDFRLLVERYQNQVYAIIIRQVGDSAAARDIAQEVFLRAYRKLDTFRGESGFSTWLIRIAINLTNNYFSSRAYRERRQAVEVDSGLPENQHYETVEKELELKKLRQAVALLSDRHREIIALCALERRSYDEAALILGIPTGTVRSRLNAARNELRKKFFSIDEA